MSVELGTKNSGTAVVPGSTLIRIPVLGPSHLKGHARVECDRGSKGVVDDCLGVESPARILAKARSFCEAKARVLIKQPPSKFFIPAHYSVPLVV